MARNPAWTREELILALDTYKRVGLPAKHDDPAIVLLSARLRKLAAISAPPDAARFRNENGAYLKLANFRSIDPATDAQGMSHGGKGDHAIWDEFADSPQALRVAADSILATL